MQITILFFATLKDRAGVKRIEMDVEEGIQVSGLRQSLTMQIPALGEALKTALVSVNHEFAFNDDVLPEGAEVAFFPPVSGG